MGHAGAIIAGGKGTAAEKMAALRKAGVTVAENPALIGETVAKALAKKRAARSAPRARRGGKPAAQSTKRARR
jgi:succinyl-CoA synthetase alpha subunit